MSVGPKRFVDYYAARRRREKRARYVARLGRPTINRRREKRRRRVAALEAQKKHCLTCGMTHAGWCPPEAFEIVTCYDCGNAFLQLVDVRPLMGDIRCGQCPAVGHWNTRPATVEDMRKHWKRYGEGAGSPLAHKGWQWLNR